MTKALEALEKLVKYELAPYYRINHPWTLSDTIEYTILKQELEHYDKTPTPPTEEEVCKALSEYLGKEVKVNNEQTFYYTEERQYYGECDEIVCGYCWEHEHKTIAFEFDLPPHLITLIGRFYEGRKEQ